MTSLAVLGEVARAHGSYAEGALGSVNPVSVFGVPSACPVGNRQGPFIDMGARCDEENMNTCRCKMPQELL